MWIDYILNLIIVITILGLLSLAYLNYNIEDYFNALVYVFITVVLVVFCYIYNSRIDQFDREYKILQAKDNQIIEQNKILKDIVTKDKVKSLSKDL